MTSEEEPVAMAGPEDSGGGVRMAGYLDKRGKMKLVSTWKRYWFVLKDQLLLYYKSQLECLNLSACRGSLNMGLASCVRPGAHRGPPSTGAQGYTIEVVTRTQVITLRTKDRGLQEQWLKALLESMAHPNISTPVRNSSGPMHFRYSLDNLPSAEELEKEDKAKEKQKTLPNRTGVNRHDSVLGRIKRMGGQSYGGSLDTILKRRPNTSTPPQRSPQQPKIPRIKAVDRMLGLHYNGESRLEEQHSHDEDDVEEVLNGSADVDEDVCTTEKEAKKICESDSANNVEEPQEVTKIKSDKVVGKARSDKKDETVVTRDENQNHEAVKCTRLEDTINCTSAAEILENDKHVSFIEVEGVLVENKLYEKTRKVRDSESVNGTQSDHVEVVNKLYEKTEINGEDGKVIVDSNIYEKTKKEVEENKEGGSEEELSSLQKALPTSEEEKLYEVMPAGGVEEAKKDSQSAENVEEEEYYCDYDQVSLMRSLNNQRSSTPEPALPPRPIAKTEGEDPEYSVYYETTPNLQSDSKSSVEVQSSEKKSLKLRDKKKSKKKKSCSVESVSSEDSSNNKKKRKMSFLRRVLKQYRKKSECDPEAMTMADNPAGFDEPEYETVDYSVALLKQIDMEDKSPPIAEDDRLSSPEKEIPKERLIGSKCLLSEQAMLELRMKLKGRDDATEASSASAVKEESEDYAQVPSSDAPEKKPVPMPRPSKQRSVEDDGDLAETSEPRYNESINRPNKPPSLPPRKVARPRSPWHDVPKNNSPIYGNFQDLGIKVAEKEEEEEEEAIKESTEPTCEKQSAPQAGEWDQELQDELLGTPRGFVYIQNKWKAAEKSCEQSRSHRRGSKGKSPIQKSPQSPETCGMREGFKLKHTRSSSSESGGSNIVGQETGANDLYSDVNKDHPSAKTIIKCFNAQSERISRKESESNEETIGTESVWANKLNNADVTQQGSTKPENGDILISHRRDSIHGRGQSDDTVVVLRKSQNISQFSKHQVMANETEHFGTINNESRSESSSSHICCEGRCSKEYGDKMNNGSGCYPSVPEKTATKEFADKTVDTSDYEECEDLMPRLNRHSDELNLLLAQLAEITSAPLLPQGAATSLVDLPDGRKPKTQAEQSSSLSPAQPESFVLGPIRRRRHSDPDYDVPRPHGSLLHLLAPNRTSSRSSGNSQSGQESDVIEATRFFGEADLTSNSARSSLSLRHSVISEVDDQQSDSSYYVSMAPDSLEVSPNRSVD